MRNRTKWIGLTVAGCVLSAVGLNGVPHDPPKTSGEPATESRHTEGRLLHAQRFSLTRPATHWWRREQPKYTSGWLAVIQADQRRLQVRQGPMPVLFVGGQTADRVNYGEKSGCLVVIVPGDFDLADAPIYFGEPGIPEVVGAPEIARELAAARARDIRAPGAEVMLQVVQDDVRYRDAEELRQAAVDLVERFSPQEQDLINGMRVPLVK